MSAQLDASSTEQQAQRREVRMCLAVGQFNCQHRHTQHGQSALNTPVERGWLCHGVLHA